MLGGGVESPVRRGDEAEYGRDVDDASTSLSTHLRQDSVRHADDAEDVDVKEPLSLYDRVLLRSTSRANTGVVDQDVEAPEPLDYPLNHAGHRPVTGHV